MRLLNGDRIFPRILSSGPSEKGTPSALQLNLTRNGHARAYVRPAGEKSCDRRGLAAGSPAKVAGGLGKPRLADVSKKSACFLLKVFEFIRAHMGGKVGQDG